MKINSMKLLIIMTELLLIGSVLAALFIIEMPEGNRDVGHMALGALFTDAFHSIHSMFVVNRKITE